ncbi:MAG: Intracellular distribution of mitochondria [Candelaria pacifica]|nr:MAG: Intracellular distribution of mitochondria [Candelaria pacifica]
MVDGNNGVVFDTNSIDTAEGHGRALDRTTSKDSSGPEPALDQDSSVKDALQKPDESSNGEQVADSIFQLTIRLPHEPYKTYVTVSSQEQVSDIRQSVWEYPHGFQYSCFHLEHQSEPINDFVELSQIVGLTADSELALVEDPYTEKEARIHFARVRELIGAAGNRIDTLHGVSAGLSLFDTIAHAASDQAIQNGNDNPAKSPTDDALHALSGYDFKAPSTVTTIVQPVPEPAPKTVKAISLSAWNPPPHHLRQRGHLLYLQITTNEGEQHQITSHVSGFYVNKSSNSKFDPFPRPPPKHHAAHSLLSLISILSPSFDSNFTALQSYNNGKDPLSTFQIATFIPSNPWMVPSASSPLSVHQPDITRTQESYLLSGAENTETLRDWNEEFQSTRELPRETMQDRVFRERLTSKLFADYNDAAARGAILVARGEVGSLNPTEGTDAQIFVYNNIFFSFGADGVGTFASEGGDEAARVATGKDVLGVKAVNQLDIEGLFTPATVVVDYLGKRMVGQSIVPGIFKQREPGEHQIDYGGVEGREVVAENSAFVSVFDKLSSALRVKKHAVWDKEGQRHDLEGSVETKGLLGTDGRKYVLDLYRITPLDVLWLEEHWREQSEPSEQDQPKGATSSYPHRMAVLRPELVELYWGAKMREYVKTEVDRRRRVQDDSSRVNRDSTVKDSDKTIDGNPRPEDDTEQTENGLTAQNVRSTESGKLPVEQERVDISGFHFALNPDIISGQIPQTDEEKEAWAEDEKEVRAACEYLRSKALPDFIQHLKDGDVGFPMDGQSLSQLIHKRGINIRYLGMVSTLAGGHGSRLDALKDLAVQEMLSRAFKHIANKYLRNVPIPLSGACIAHLLNCFLGAGLNQNPHAEVDQSLQSTYAKSNLSFDAVTPKAMIAEIAHQVKIRFGYSLEESWHTNLKHLQLLREIAIKLGLQLEARDYSFTKLPDAKGDDPDTSTHDISNPPSTNGHGASNGKRKKKAMEHSSPVSRVTFCSSDIVNIVPVVKEASPRSTLAEEALEAGRISIIQNQKELGKDLILESLSLHEQIYGILHPEVARVYHQVSMLYYQLEDKAVAVELARKAIIIFERTVGIDASETVLGYLNLGLFEHQVGNTKVALTYIRHALELWKLIYGLHHPDSITTTNNAAVMLQNLKYYHESRLWFEASLSLSEEMFGVHSVNAATLLFQLAQALALDQDSKGAVNRMRQAYNIFLAELGSSDKNTKEAENWLEQLTQNAVSIAKHAKDLQSRKYRRVHLTPRVTLGTRPQPQVGQSSTEAADGKDPRSSIGLDPRSIDELMKFIEDGGDTSKRSPPKKRPGRGNPRRRGGATVGTPA